MAKLSRDDVLKLARLSRLTLTDEEVEEFRKELESILEYVTVLQSVDVADLEPTTQVTRARNVMRADEVHDYGVSRDELLSLLPQRQDDQIKVQRMVG